jgi:hypothetical protein
MFTCMLKLKKPISILWDVYFSTNWLQTLFKLNIYFTKFYGWFLSQSVILIIWLYKIINIYVVVINYLSLTIKILIFWVMLTCALRAHDKIYKNRNIAFNDTKNLIFSELNTPQDQ